MSLQLLFCWLFGLLMVCIFTMTGAEMMPAVVIEPDRAQSGHQCTESKGGYTQYDEKSGSSFHDYRWMVMG
jgi:hypothetical protein